ncbi:hypothetical protein ACOMHN_023511 [Nucella lapillus]
MYGKTSGKFEDRTQSDDDTHAEVEAHFSRLFFPKVMDDLIEMANLLASAMDEKACHILASKHRSSRSIPGRKITAWDYLLAVPEASSHTVVVSRAGRAQPEWWPRGRGPEVASRCSLTACVLAAGVNRSSNAGSFSSSPMTAGPEGECSPLGVPRTKLSTWRRSRDVACQTEGEGEWSGECSESLRFLQDLLGCDLSSPCPSTTLTTSAPSAQLSSELHPHTVPLNQSPHRAPQPQSPHRAPQPQFPHRAPQPVPTPCPSTTVPTPCPLTSPHTVPLNHSPHTVPLNQSPHRAPQPQSPHRAHQPVPTPCPSTTVPTPCPSTSPHTVPLNHSPP